MIEYKQHLFILFILQHEQKFNSTFATVCHNQVQITLTLRVAVHVQIRLATTEQFNFQAKDTIGFTWSNYGTVSYNDVSGYNYCEDSVGQPAVGGTLSLVGGRYGSRLYSFEAVYMENGPGVYCQVYMLGLLSRKGDVVREMLSIESSLRADRLDSLRNALS